MENTPHKPDNPRPKRLGTILVGVGACTLIAFLSGMALLGTRMGRSLWLPQVESSLSHNLKTKVQVKDLVLKWDGLHVLGITLYDDNQDTLLSLNNAQIKWNRFPWKAIRSGGSHLRLAELRFDSLYIKVTALSNKSGRGNTNWSIWLDKFGPVKGTPSKPSLDWYLGRLRFQSLSASLQASPDLLPEFIGTSPALQDGVVEGIRLSSARFHAKWSGTLRIQGLDSGMRCQGVLRRNGGQWALHGLNVQHPALHGTLSVARWNRTGQQTATDPPGWTFHHARFEVNPALLPPSLISKGPWPVLGIQLDRATFAGSSLGWNGLELKMGNEILAKTRGSLEASQGYKSLNGRVHYQVSAQYGWLKKVEPLVLNSPMRHDWEALKGRLPLDAAWTAEGLTSLQQGAMAFNALLKSASKPGDPSSSENWSLGIEANPTYTQWSGQISGPRYTVRDASLGRMTFEKPRVQVRLLPGGLWEGTLSAAALQWNQELLPALRAEMKYREQHLEATLSLQDQAQYLQATLDARMVQNQIQKLNLNGRMDFKLPPLAGLCYPLHAQGDFEGTYDAKGGKVNTLNAQWKQGAISCPEQIIPIEHATFSWNRMANQGMSQCAITWDQDSVHTQGLDELEDVSVALGQIGNFLIGDNQVRGDHNPFWAFARINNLGKYLALLEAKPAIEGNHVQVFANWTQPSQRSIRLDAQQVSWSTFYSPKITIRTENLGPYMLVQANLDSLTNQKQVLLDRINFQQIRDSLGSVLSLKGNHSRQGTEVLLRGHLQADANTWNLLVDSLELHASAQHWTARPGGQIIKRGDRWELLGLNLQSGVSGMNFQGVLSDLPSDQLRMTVRDFDLGQLLSAFGQPAGWLNGIISGDVTAGSVLQEPTFSGNLKMENLAIDSIPLGLMEWSSTFDPGANRLQLQGLLSSDNLELASVKGWIQTDQEGLPCQLEGKLSRIPLQLLEMFLLPHLDSIRGQARATVQWGGFLSKPELRGFLVLENGSLYIPYLKNTYRFNDTVWVEPDRFLFARVPVQDKDRGNALLKGQVNHRNFREWGYGFLCDSIQNLLVLQEPRLLKGDAYHGLGRVSGQAQITGDEYLTDLQANLISQKGSRLVIPLDDLSSEEQQDFVRFVTNQDDKDLEDSLGFAGKQIALRGIDLKISLALNPETEISLLLDRRFGDQIKGVGNGKLDLTYTKEGNLSLAGNYLFTKGEYAFNLGNLASKNFSIQEGSRIDWNGDPYDGVMKINAIYKQRASVRNLLTGSAASTDRRNMVPVETHLGLNGPILKPEVHFQIKLPTVNSSDPNDILVQQINRINNNEQELNNQVLGLMVSGQFIPEENMSSANLGINTGATAFNSVTELLTNRLSNLLNNSLGGGVNLGINYRGDLGTGLLAGNGAGNLAADSNRRDLNVALNTTLFNNRLTIDGNLAMGNSLQVNAQNMAGEIQIEYKVNPSGTIRAKAFNRLDDRVLFNQTLNYRQGLGISYNRNFDRWGELFRRQSKSQKRP